MSSKYIHLHVPKTAGSMFRSIVVQNFGNEAVIENPLMSELNYTTHQIDRLFYLYPYRFYMGHVFRLENSLKAQDGKVNLIAFVRDPVDKALSAYYYLRNRDLTKSDHPVKIYSFTQMVERIGKLDQVDSFDLDSSQLDWLTGHDSNSLSLVSSAVDSNRLLLFPTDRFDDACILLEKIFPNDFKDCSYGVAVNKSDRPDLNDEDVKAAMSLPWIKKDRQLYEYACLNMERMIKEYFRGDLDLENARRLFNERCQYKSTSNNTKHRFIRGKISAIKRMLFHG